MFKTVKRSSFYLGGVVGLCLLGAWWAERKARSELFGSDSTISLNIDKGGSYLDLKTVRDEDHYAYNR